jgi:ubiquinol-cytochrome c reductase subunit 8
VSAFIDHSIDKMLTKTGTWALGETLVCRFSLTASTETPCIFNTSYLHLTGSPIQKYVTVYSISPNRLRPLKGTLYNAIFNTARRTRGQIMFWGPPFALGYAVMQWAIEQYDITSNLTGVQDNGLANVWL